MNNLTVDAGQMAVFNCHIDFSCMVTTIHWFHAPENSSSSLIKTARSPGDPHVHLIRSADPSHSGTYSCVAQNVLGQVIITIIVIIVIKIVIIIIPLTPASLRMSSASSR